MSHDHHHHAPQKFSLAFGLAVGLNLLFVIIEAIYAYSANSMSLLADAGHNLGDVLGLGMAWAALLLTAKKPTAKFSYGYKRTTILAALINAVILVIATIIIAAESVDKLIYPQSVHETVVMIVAAIGIVINGGTALMFMRGHDDLNIRGAFLHLAYDALISFGVVVTAALVWWTQWHWLDPVVGLLIAITILYGTWGLLRNAFNLIMDAVPHNIDASAVEQFLCSLPIVSNVHHVHIWGLSTNEVALTAHLVIPGGIKDQQLHDIQQQLKQKFSIHHSTIQIEQDPNPCEPCCH